eukprot:TRINITY_DN3347_c0_g1_i2.p1 TRINITY_DN3347_c0_g1~~TRINITY_DN3347_c0_g1_i2.p1  ORF type:complete len:140 (-),score=2.78 TRINITY_DN3347_c0_g1_i2:66-485(-)
MFALLKHNSESFSLHFSRKRVVVCTWEDGKAQLIRALELDVPASVALRVSLRIASESMGWVILSTTNTSFQAKHSSLLSQAEITVRIQNDGLHGSTIHAKSQSQHVIGDLLHSNKHRLELFFSLVERCPEISFNNRKSE